MTMMLITMRLTMMRMGTVVVMIRIMNGSEGTGPELLVCGYGHWLVVVGYGYWLVVSEE